MKPRRGIRKWLRFPASVRPLERDVADEVQFHLESRIEELVASGVDPAWAHEQAEREFGDVSAAHRELARIDHRREHRRRWAGRLEALRHEWGAALRGLVRAPGFTLAVALTLALGIGANATMFGVIDRLMLRPSPHVYGADRLRRVFVRITHPHWGTFTQNAISLPVVAALRQDPVFAGAAASWSTSGSLGRGADAQRGAFLVVTPSLFTISGVAPYLGRFFTEDDDVNSAGTPAAVLSYSFWQRRYGADSTIVGRTIDAFGTAFIILGITPPGYRGFETRAVDMFLPMSTVARIRIGAEWATTTDWFWINGAVKIAAGVSEEQARTRAELHYQRVYASDSSHARAHVLLAPVIPGRGPTPSAEERVAVWLVGVAVIVLAIATANVANLLLTRAARRRREIAVRVALGVSRRRLVTQLLCESLLLAFLGAIGALLLTQWGGALVRGVLLGELAPEDSIIDVRVFVVAALVALGAGLAAGLAPAVLATGPAATDALKAGGRGGTYRRSRLRVGLLVAQAMLSLVLVVGAALFVKSLTNAVREPLGVDTRHVLLSDMDLEAAGFGSAEQRAIYERALERVVQLPVVESAALTTTVPFYSSIATELRVEGIDSLPRFSDGGPYITRVGPEYFRTLGMRVTRGRFLNKDDVLGSPSVAVVNETMARRIWQGRDPLGTCLFVGEESRTCTRVVGVVNNARRGTIGRDEEAVLYYAPLAQDTTTATMRALLVRVRGDPRAAVPTVQNAVQSVNSSLPFADVRVLQDLVEPHLRPWRLGATLFVVFGCIALTLAAVGLYSVVSYDTAQRTQEIGVRMALGAGRSRILKMVLADGLRSAGAGVVLGVLAAIAAGGALASLLYEVSPRDPLLLTLSTLLMLVVALVATAVPAWRATRIAPNNALRSE